MNEIKLKNESLNEKVTFYNYSFFNYFLFLYLNTISKKTLFAMIMFLSGLFENKPDYHKKFHEKNSYLIDHFE